MNNILRMIETSEYSIDDYYNMILDINHESDEDNK